ncbi:uncharacterized protein [Diabrotica undecimpunctata]|uniref:uncharacterized protein n=1 Tax=Diabrotica undecimpunctata TaxID=50387 RepID=UPI003B632AA8
MILSTFFLIIFCYKLSNVNCASNLLVFLEEDKPLSYGQRISKTHRGDKLGRHENNWISILQHNSQMNEPTNKLFDTSIFKSILEKIRSKLILPPWSNDILEDNIKIYPLWLPKVTKQFNTPYNGYVFNPNSKLPKKDSKVKSDHKVKNIWPYNYVTRKESKPVSPSIKKFVKTQKKSVDNLKNKYIKNLFELPSKKYRSQHVSSSKFPTKHGNIIVGTVKKKSLQKRERQLPAIKNSSMHEHISLEKLAVKNESQPISFPKSQLSYIPSKSTAGQHKPTLNTNSKIRSKLVSNRRHNSLPQINSSSENPVQEHKIKLRSGQFMSPTSEYVVHHPKMNHTINLEPKQSEISTNSSLMDKKDPSNVNVNQTQILTDQSFLTDNLVIPQNRIINSSIKDNIMPTAATYKDVKYHDRKHGNDLLGNFKVPVGPKPVDNSLINSIYTKIKSDETSSTQNYNFIINENIKPVFNKPFSILTQQEEKILNKPTAKYEKNLNIMTVTSAYTFVTDNKIQQVHTTTSDIEEERNPVHVPVVNSTRNISTVKSAIKKNIVPTSQTDSFKRNYNRKQFEGLPLDLNAQMEQSLIDISVDNSTINSDVKSTTPTFTLVGDNSTQLFDNLPSSGSVERDGTHVDSFYRRNPVQEHKIKLRSGQFIDPTDKYVLHHPKMNHTINLELKRSEIPANGSLMENEDDITNVNVEQAQTPMHFLIDDLVIPQIRIINSSIKDNLIPTSSTYKYVEYHDGKQVGGLLSHFKVTLEPKHVDISLLNSKIKSVPLSTTENYRFIENVSIKPVINKPFNFLTQQEEKIITDPTYNYEQKLNIMPATSAYNFVTDKIQQVYTTSSDFEEERNPVYIPIVNSTRNTSTIKSKIKNNKVSASQTDTIEGNYNRTQFEDLPLVSNAQMEQRPIDVSVDSSTINSDVMSTTPTYTFVEDLNSTKLFDNLPSSGSVGPERTYMDNRTHTINSDFEEERNSVHIPILNSTRNTSTIKSEIKNKKASASQTDTIEGNYNRTQFEDLPLVSNAQMEQRPIDVSVYNSTINSDVMSTTPTYTFVEDLNSTKLFDNLPSSGSVGPERTYMDNRTHTINSDFEEERNYVHIPILNSTTNISTVKSAINNYLASASQADTIEGNYNGKHFESLPLFSTAQMEQIPIDVSVDSSTINSDVMSTTPTYTFVENHKITQLFNNLPFSGSTTYRFVKHYNNKQVTEREQTTLPMSIPNFGTKDDVMSTTMTFNAVEGTTKPMDTPVANYSKIYNMMDASSTDNIVDHNSKYARSLLYDYVVQREPKFVDISVNNSPENVQKVTSFTSKYNSVNNPNNKQIYRLPYHLAREGKERPPLTPLANRATHNDLILPYGFGINQKNKPFVTLTVSTIKHKMESINNYFGIPLENSVVVSYTDVLITNPKNPYVEGESSFGYNPVIQYIPYYYQ